MTRFLTSTLALIVAAAMVSLGCGEGTSSEGEYSGVTAKLVEDPAAAEELAITQDSFAPEEQTPPDAPALPETAPGIIEGVGTYFEVTDSSYLNITLASTEPVQLRLESAPSMVTMTVEAAEGAASTQITLNGLEPTTTYYKYTDDYHNLEQLVTDESGTCAYAQDLGKPHLVFIQPTTSTIYLSDTGWSEPVGTWDPIARTGTLTQNVTETIQIDSDGITLDGAGFTVSGSGQGFGVYVSDKSDVTIKDVNVHGFFGGMALTSTQDSTVIDSTVSNNTRRGIQTVLGSGTTLQGNTVSNNGPDGRGVIISSCPSSTVSGNTVEGHRYDGITVTNSSDNTLANNTVSNNNYGIFVRGASHNITLHGNEALDNGSGIAVAGYSNPPTTVSGCVVEDNTVHNALGTGLSVNTAQNCTVSNNAVLEAGGTGIVLYYVSDSVVVDNTATFSGWRGYERDGIRLYGNSPNNSLIGNVASDNVGSGISIGFPTSVVVNNAAENNATNGIVIGGNSTLTGNVVSGNAVAGVWVGGNQNVVHATTASHNQMGIALVHASDNLLSGNTVFENQYGVYLSYADFNTVSNNTASANDIGIYVTWRSYSNALFSNRISENTHGVGIDRQSLSNVIHNNDFLYNDSQLTCAFTGINYLNRTRDEGGGNYWSNWNTPDEDPADGFVDFKYYACYDPYSYEAIDYFPLASPFGGGADSDGPITSDVTATPSVVEVGGTVTLTATVDDSETGGSNVASAEDTLDGGATWNAMGGTWDDPIVVVDSSFAAPATAGVYEVCVRGTDALDNVGEPECVFLVAYDPSGGFVTGGGWIDSPEGAYAPDPTLIGKANFGFVSKYKKGASVPTGNTEFQFKVADLNFKSTSYDWLVIAGGNARYKGEGTINGVGSYKFMLWGGDGTPDTFRIRIWTEDEATAAEMDVYDNGFGQDLGGGSVVIHKGK